MKKRSLKSEFEKWKADKKIREDRSKIVKKYAEKIFKGIDFYNGLTIIGFLMSQVFWIWLLLGFSRFLFIYINQLGITRFTGFEFQKLFWTIYGFYFVISIVLIKRLLYDK